MKMFLTALTFLSLFSSNAFAFDILQIWRNHNAEKEGEAYFKKEYIDDCKFSEDVTAQAPLCFNSLQKPAKAVIGYEDNRRITTERHSDQRYLSCTFIHSFCLNQNLSMRFEPFTDCLKAAEDANFGSLQSENTQSLCVDAVEKNNDIQYIENCFERFKKNEVIYQSEDEDLNVDNLYKCLNLPSPVKSLNKNP